MRLSVSRFPVLRPHVLQLGNKLTTSHYYHRSLLSPRFLLTFFACGFTLLGKGFALASVISPYDGGHVCGEFNNLAAVTSFTIATFFLPGLIIGLFSSCHRTLLRTFLTHPSVYLLPVFTHFTFSANSNRACCRRGDDEEKNFR